MSDIHLPVFCLLGGGAGGRILDRERERETERKERLGISTLCMCLLVD